RCAGRCSTLSAISGRRPRAQQVREKLRRKSWCARDSLCCDEKSVASPQIESFLKSGLVPVSYRRGPRPKRYFPNCLFNFSGAITLTACEKFFQRRHCLNIECRSNVSRTLCCWSRV